MEASTQGLTVPVKTAQGGRSQIQYNKTDDARLELYSAASQSYDTTRSWPGRNEKSTSIDLSLEVTPGPCSVPHSPPIFSFSLQKRLGIALAQG